MSFPCNGSNHVSGINNEKFLVSWLNQDRMITNLFPNLPDNCIAEHLGGTQRKEDVAIREKFSNLIRLLISGKEKKSIKGGTFDWTNSTAYLTHLIKNNSFQIKPLKDFLERAKQTRNFGKVSDATINRFRSELHEATELFLNSLDSEQIRDIIYSQMIIPNNDMYVMIKIIDIKTIYHFSFDDHNLNQLINDKRVKFSLVKKRKSTHCDSRTVFATVHESNGLTNVIDTGIRIRVHLNNGVSALLGRSKTNNTSSFCIKLQQDNFERIITIAKSIKYQ